MHRLEKVKEDCKGLSFASMGREFLSVISPMIAAALSDVDGGLVLSCSISSITGWVREYRRKNLLVIAVLFGWLVGWLGTT